MADYFDPLNDGEEGEDRMSAEDLHESNLARYIGSALVEAAAYIDEEVTPERVTNTEYYYGEPFGDEEEGRSRVVSHDVEDTVNAIMPSLMRVFYGAERPIEYTPETEQDVAFVEQAGDYAQYVMDRDNHGFMILHSAFLDALVRRTGVIKAWWDDTTDVVYEDYEGLDEAAMELLREDPEADILKESEYLDEVAFEQMQAEYEQAVAAYQQQVMQYQQVMQQVQQLQQQGQQVPEESLPQEPQEPQEPDPADAPVLYDVSVRFTRETGRIRAEAVPPEELIWSRGCRSLTEGWRQGHVVAHRTEKTVAELIRMGFDEDELEDFTSSDELSGNEERVVRDPAAYEPDGADKDPMGRVVLYTEAWAALDADDDGIAELRKIVCLGDSYEMVYHEPASYVPLADFCPKPEPHKATGRAVADVLRDIQRIKSNILRGMLDSLAQAIRPRTAVVQGEVNLDDVLNNEVGGIVRMRRPGMAQQMESTFVGQQAFPMVEYMDKIKEQRTGITEATQGLTSEVMQSTTKAAVSATVEASRQQIELIARIFAETGMRQLYRILLKIMVQHQDKPRTVQMRNQQWISVDPRTWNANMGVSVSTSLGSGTNEDKMLMLTAISEKQEQIIQSLGPDNPLVTLGQYSHTLRHMVELAGFKDASRYFNSLPVDFTPPQPEGGEGAAESPEMILAQVQREEIQANIQKKQAELELDRQKAEVDMNLRREEMMRRDDRERDRIEADAVIRAVKDGLDPKYLLALMNRNRQNEQEGHFE